MGRINEKIHHFKPLIAVMLCGLVCLLAATGGCSSASWIIHHNGSGDDLAITESDVDAMIKELSLVQPKDTETILYNEGTDRYELMPGAYRNAVRDGIIRRIQDRKISAFLEDYRPESLMDALRKDTGTAGAFILLLAILGSLFY
jgi:hypothetical protein